MPYPVDFPMTEGLDVSFWQQLIDFHEVALWANFVFIKATQGLYVDPFYAANTGGFESVGLPQSPYLFYEPLVPGLLQVNKYVDVVNSNGGLKGMPPMVDVEKIGGLRSNLKGLLDDLRSRFGVRKLIIYTRKDVWDWYGLGDTGDIFFWANYPWLTWKEEFANIIVENGMKPLMSSSVNHWEFWQVTDKGDGKNRGVSSHGLDIDFFNGTKSQFEEFLVTLEIEKENPWINVEPVDPATRALMIIKLKGNMNLRSSPGIGNNIVGTGLANSEYYLIGVNTEDPEYLWGCIGYNLWVALEKASGYTYVEGRAP